MDAGWTRLKKIFEAALALPHDERSVFLERACEGDETFRAHIESLLEAEHNAPSFLEQPTHGDSTVPAEPGYKSGDRIGRYKLLELIGEGGFGSVFMAEQTEPVVRRVAVKVIKLGMDTKQVIARFEAERQALAMMDHPNIARVLDAGATESGRPYFVMELVRGIPITDYCDTNRLTARERLDLFISICRAVQHAHTKGIIHRDIKPTNVLVTLHDGVPIPKVIDFGIAKATNARLTEKTLFTEFRQLIGTPAYMSPEQAEMSGLDVDTRTDVYSLGVLLYELLTGVTPFDSARLRSAGFDEIRRIIREEEPPRPSTRLSERSHAVEPTPTSGGGRGQGEGASTGESQDSSIQFVATHRKTNPAALSRYIRGDLDWIIMRSLEKDRTRRYETANDLAADILRFLEDEPVIARPPSRAYRLKKMMRRNKAVFATGGLIAAVLVVATALSLFFGLSEQRQRGIAETALDDRDIALAAETKAKEDAAKRAEELEQVTEFQQERFSGIDVPGMGLQIRANLLQKIRAAGERSQLTAEEVDARAKEAEQLFSGADFTGLALAALDENIFRLAFEAIDTQFADQPLVKASLLRTLGLTVLELGLAVQAIAPLEEALTIRRSELGNEHRDTLNSVGDVGWMLVSLGNYDEAMPYIKESLDTGRRIFGDEDTATLVYIESMGGLLMHMGRYDEAMPFLNEVLETRRRVLGEEHADTVSSVNNMGALLQGMGRYEQALAHLQQALEAKRDMLGNNDPSTLTSISNVGDVLTAMGRYGDALTYYLEVLEASRRVFGDEHSRTLASIEETGSLFDRMGQFDRAMPYYREALDTARRVLGAEHPATLQAMRGMGSLLKEMGQYDRAMPYAREALDTARRVFGAEHRITLLAMHAMGSLLATMDRDDDAIPYYTEALETARRLYGNDNPTTLTYINGVGFALWRQERYEEAMPYFSEALEGKRRTLGDNHPSTLVSINNMGYLLRNMGRYGESLPYFRESLEGMRIVLTNDHPHTLNCISGLGDALRNMGRLDEALPYITEAIDTSRRVLGDEHPVTLDRLYDLSRILRAMERFDEALALCREGLETSRRLRGDEDRITLRFKQGIGLVLTSMDKHEEALRYASEVLDTNRRIHGSDSPATLFAVHNMGSILEDLGRYDEAMPYFIEGLETSRRVLAGHPDLLHAVSGMGGVLVSMGRFDEALPYLNEALEGRRRLHGDDNPLTLGIVADIIDLYDAWHEAEPDGGYDAKATEWRERLEEMKVEAEATQPEDDPADAEEDESSDGD